MQSLVIRVGLAGGIDVDLDLESRPDDVRNVQLYDQMLRVVGIRTKIVSLERLASLDKVRNRHFQLWGFLAPGRSDPDLEGPNNWWGFCNPEVDKCMLEGRAEYDSAKRHEIYKRCQTILFEGATHVPTWTSPGNWVFRKEVRGFTLQWYEYDLRRAWIDK